MESSYTRPSPWVLILLFLSTAVLVLPIAEVGSPRQLAAPPTPPQSVPNPLAQAISSLATGRDGAPIHGALCAAIGAGTARCSLSGNPTPHGVWQSAGIAPDAAGSSYLQESVVVYDARDRGVLYYGQNGQIDGSDLWGAWFFRNGSWMQLPPTSLPAPSELLAAYDTADGYVVLVDTQDPMYGTWIFAGQHFALLPEDTAPSARWGEVLTYDDALSEVILFGGSTAGDSSAGLLNDTWSFSAGSWSQLRPATSPSPRSFAEAAYFPPGEEIVLVGGYTWVNGVPTWVNDTWVFRDGNWTNLGISGAPPVSYQTETVYLVYDPNSSTIFSLGPCYYGYWCTGGATDDEREFDGTAWASTGVSYNGGVAAPPISVEGLGAILFGYTSASGVVETLVHGKSGWNVWSNPSSPGGISWGAMVYDAADGYDLLIANPSPGAYSMEIWTYSNGRWSQPGFSNPLGVRDGAALAYDATSSQVILFGGWDSGYDAVVGDTWTFHAGKWTQVTYPNGSAEPAPGFSLPMAYDPATKSVILLDGNGSEPAVAWSFSNGSWSKLASPGTWIGESGSLVWDATDQLLVAVGNVQTTGVGYWNGGGGDLEETWTFNGTAWTNVTGPTDAVPPVFWPNSVGPDPVGGLLAFTSVGWEGSATAETWQWTAQAGWQNITGLLSLEPDPRQGAVVAPDPQGRGLLMYGGEIYDQFSASNYLYPDDLWIFANASLSSPPGIVDFAATSADMGLGNSTDLVTTLNGSAQVSFAYTGLPPGCLSANVSDLGCTPTSEGIYVPVVSVTGLNGSISMATPLVVGPALSVNLTAQFNPVLIGVGDNISFQPAGGWGRTYAGLEGLPSSSSCGIWNYTSGNLSWNFTYFCTFSAAGQFNLSATAYDQLGSSARAYLVLDVLPIGYVAPAITSFSANPSSIHLGNATYANLTESGTGPLLNTFGGLPPGCVSANTTSLRCVPSSTGNYTVTVQVRDLYGGDASASVNLSVVSNGSTQGGTSGSGGSGGSGGGGGSGNDSGKGGTAPLSVTLTLAPFHPRAGSPLAVRTSVTGGVPPYAYRYAGFPDGCDGENASNFTCVPISWGSYNPVVIVTDALGVAAEGSQSFDVVAPSSSGTATTAFPISLLTPEALAVAALMGGVAGFWLGRKVRRRPLKPRHP